MKRLSIKIQAALTGLAVAAGALLPFSIPSEARAAASDWQVKAVSIVPRWADDFTSDSFRQSVRNAKDAGVTHITLVIPYYQSDDYSSDVGPGPNTPSNSVLGVAIDFIHGEGLKVVLKPHVDKYSGGWRGLIQASDRDAWYKNYGHILTQLGTVAEDHGADMIVIGTELIGMASSYRDHDNTQRWVSLIDNLRSYYSGPLTYSANWGHGQEYVNEFEYIDFWPNLDYIGISAYFEFHNDGSVQAIKDKWRTIDEEQISKLQAEYGKQILFTEVGYRSVDNGHVRPWDYEMWGNYNPDQQVKALQALFEYWDSRPYFKGISIWDWSSDPNHGGHGDIGYTVHNKPAEETMRQWFTQGGGSGDPDDPGDPPPSDGWSATAPEVNGAQSGSSISIPVTVSNSGSATNVIVDIEIYDQNGSRAFQQFFEGQTISHSQQGSYRIDWTPPYEGSFTLKLGIFRSDWGQNYYWNNDVRTFSVGSAGQNPPQNPGSHETDIWWPTNGAAVNGTQPFKAMLRNISINDYKMYWQVDGDQLVEMYNSDVDYPHKEFMVDLSGWNWKGEGPYTINFVSQDGSGNTIAERSVDIYVR